MSALTKEQMQKLTLEAQEAFASLTLAETKRRAQLLETAWRHRAQPWIRALVPALLLLAFVIWDAWTITRTDRLLLFAVILIAYSAIQFEANCINRRLDALLELLDTDLRGQKTAAGHQEGEPSD